MIDKVVTEYLNARRKGEKGARSPYIVFTLAKLDALPAEPFDYEIRAKEPLMGLICRVRRSGVKSLEVFRKPSGSPKPVRVKVGRVGDAPLTGTSEDSIKLRLQSVLHDLSKGINPNEVRKAKNLKKAAEALTLSAALEMYLVDSSLKESTSKGYRAIINNHLKIQLDKQLAGILTKALVKKLHKQITEKKGPVAANNAMRVLRAVGNHARSEKEDHLGQSPIPSWPISGRQQNKRFWNKEKRKKSWIKPEYLLDWWSATEELANEYSGDGSLGRDYLQFLILTGLRRREATSLLWQDIDFRSKTFTVPDTKNGEPLELPCSDHMMTILKRRQQLSDAGPFVLEEPKKFVAWVKLRSGVNFMVNDLRRSFITYAESLDFSVYAIKALVNHSTGSRDVTEGYLQLSTERLRRPMQGVTDYVISRASADPSKVRKITG